MTKSVGVKLEQVVRCLCGTWLQRPDDCQSVEAVCRNLLAPIHLLLTRGTPKVIVGEILYCGKMRVGGSSLEAYNAKVSFLLIKNIGGSSDH